MERKVVRTPLIGGEQWNPMDEPINGYSASTEFSGFCFDGCVPAEAIERREICRVNYFLSPILKLTDLEGRTQ